jgi:hypothetical protein
MLKAVRKSLGLAKEHKKHKKIKLLIDDLRPLATNRQLVRYGPDRDGGYLLPDDLKEIAGCISPGISTECRFDKQIADLGIPVHQADASVDGPPISHEKFAFSKLFLDTYNSDTTIHIDDYCRYVSPGEDLLLQMDVEGAEYRVLHSASDALIQRFRIMVIEFHDLDSLFTPFGLREISNLFRRLLRTHAVVHIHPNNYGRTVSVGSITIPKVMEFTFYRRDRAVFQPVQSRFPHPLDRPNRADRPEVILPAIWHY